MVSKTSNISIKCSKNFPWGLPQILIVNLESIYYEDFLFLNGAICGTI